MKIYNKAPTQIVISNQWAEFQPVTIKNKLNGRKVTTTNSTWRRKVGFQPLFFYEKAQIKQ